MCMKVGVGGVCAHIMMLAESLNAVFVIRALKGSE